MTTRTLDEKDKYAVTGSALGAVASAAVAAAVLRAAFNADVGNVRILMLVSPT